MPIPSPQPAVAFRSFSGIPEFAETAGSTPIHLGIGNYDGFHCGHRAIFKKAQAEATLGGGIVGALTFSPHPEVFFKGKDAIRLIFSRERKDTLFANAGLNFAIHEPFSEHFAEIPAEEFVRILKKKIPTLAGLYVGDNFRFGAKRRGDIRMLSALSNEAGISLHVVSPVNYLGERISSTRIRTALTEGKIEDANAMLSLPYESGGIVAKGNQLGRTIGFPTLNLAWSPELRPKFGAYVVRLRVPATGQVFHGIANYGVRPTITSDARPLLETHLLDVPADTPPPTYGDFICVQWFKFLRPEARFQGVDALKAQLELDKIAALTNINAL